MTDATTTWLTQDAFDRLQSELEDREGPIRGQIVDRIQAAREEGDLKENGGYHAAKDEQGKNEARVKQLRALLEAAQIGSPPTSAAGIVTQGLVLTVKLVEYGDTETFLLGSREEAATAGIDVYSPTSPLGAAVLGATVGSTVSYKTPRGAAVEVQILDAVPFTD